MCFISIPSFLYKILDSEVLEMQPVSGQNRKILSVCVLTVVLGCACLQSHSADLPLELNSSEQSQRGKSISTIQLVSYL